MPMPSPHPSHALSSAQMLHRCLVDQSCAIGTGALGPTTPEPNQPHALPIQRKSEIRDTYYHRTRIPFPSQSKSLCSTNEKGFYSFLVGLGFGFALPFRSDPPRVAGTVFLSDESTRFSLWTGFWRQPMSGPKDCASWTVHRRERVNLRAVTTSKSYEATYLNDPDREADALLSETPL